MTRKLSREWPECVITVVTGQRDFDAALKRETYDLVLSDYLMPSFSGLEALATARAQCPDIPFIIVSGTIGDEVAVESLKAGANDYVLKDRAARLVPAIRHVLNHVEESRRRKRAEIAHQESEALKSAIMDAALDCIIVMDHEGRVLEFNPAAEKAFGYSHQEMVGQFLAEKIMPAELRARQQEVMLHCLADGNVPLLDGRMEITGMRADQSQFPIEWDIVPINLRERHVFTAYLRDITARKQAEEKVNELNRDLVRRNQEIQNFYHTLSHELKTPLTSAREFVSLVMDGMAGPVTTAQTEYLAIAKDSCDQLRVCIDDLLDTTRLETGKLALELKPVSPAPLLQRTVTALSLKAVEKGIALVIEAQPDLPLIILDEHRITQVVTNLLNNAINHTAANGKITVRACETPGRPEWLQVSVSDTGCGIPKPEQEFIFDRLYQVKNGDATSEHGIGLGLYLCRELVQLHGGSIWVESEPGKGSTFFFALPRDQEMLRFDVLVMDDDAQLLDVTGAILSVEYNVRTAGDGMECLDEMRRKIPDVVVIDLAMPGVDGPAVLREIRTSWGSSIPIVVYTAHSGGELMKQAMEYSPFTLLAKPCPAAQILETVRKTIRSANTSFWRRRQLTA